MAVHSITLGSWQLLLWKGCANSAVLIIILSHFSLISSIVYVTTHLITTDKKESQEDDFTGEQEKSAPPRPICMPSYFKASGGGIERQHVNQWSMEELIAVVLETPTHN